MENVLSQSKEGNKLNFPCNCRFLKTNVSDSFYNFFFFLLTKLNILLEQLCLLLERSKFATLSVDSVHANISSVCMR